MMKFRPLGDRVVVERLPAETRIGGILLPDVAQQKMTRARVLAVGSGRYTEDGVLVPLDVHPGDLVVFGKYSGQDLTLDGREVNIMREDEILAVIDEPAAAFAAEDLAASEFRA